MTETCDGRLNYSATWRELRDSAVERLEAKEGKITKQEQVRPPYIEAFRDFLLACYSEEKRLELGTEWEPLKGLDGARLVAEEKLQLHPGELSELPQEKLARVLHRELHNFKLPQKAASACYYDLEDNALLPMWERHQDLNDE